MKKILSVFGTRPEAIKMAPLVKELEKHSNRIENIVCVTAQHRQMLDQVLDLFKITPDYDLDIMQPGQDLFDITCKVLQGIRPILKKETPDLILVHGDTSTTMAASLAAFYCKIPVGHIEAGLRTHEKFEPFPEEINRKITSSVTDFHFTPTETGKKNLLLEGISEKSIHITGNTVIDALLDIRSRIHQEKFRETIKKTLIQKHPDLQPVLQLSDQRLRSKRLILVTGHRRENFGIGFENICQALARIARSNPSVNIIYPVHLNPSVQEPVRRILGDKALSNVFLIDPIDYLPFVFLMDRSYMIITDSGGVQEEAPSLGVPVLVMRDTTERPEAVEAGTVKLVGTDPDQLFESISTLLTNPQQYQKMSQSINPYGDGNASARIVNIILKNI